MRARSYIRKNKEEWCLCVSCNSLAFKSEDLEKPDYLGLSADKKCVFFKSLAGRVGVEEWRMSWKKIRGVWEETPLLKGG